MKISFGFPAYDPAKFGKPWIGKVTSFYSGRRPRYTWGSFRGETAFKGCAGRVEIDAEVGDVLRWGQKNLTAGSLSEANWAIVGADYLCKYCTRAEAVKHWQDKAMIPPPVPAGTCVSAPPSVEAHAHTIKLVASLAAKFSAEEQGTLVLDLMQSFSQDLRDEIASHLGYVLAVPAKEPHTAEEVAERIVAKFRALGDNTRAVECVKAVRAITGLGLKEAKEFMDARWQRTSGIGRSL